MIHTFDDDITYVVHKDEYREGDILSCKDGLWKIVEVKLAGYKVLITARPIDEDAGTVQ